MSVVNEPRPASSAKHAFAFGSLRLLPDQRLLLEGDKPVRLGSRALDILTVLVERAGRVVPKEELMARVWPNVFVDESNLKMQVSALRRAVGDGQGGTRYIVTVPGRGYEFVAPVSRTEDARVAAPPNVPTAGTHNLPVTVTRMIGRDETLAALVSRLSRERLVTIVGAGGIGKTTLALSVAEELLSAYEHGVWLIDLAPLAEPPLVASTVATVLGLEIHAEDPLPSLVAGLAERRMLLVLDNCEHVIEAAAKVAEALLRSAPGIGILATSREPLRVAGEREYRLGPLASPTSSKLDTASQAQDYPAVQLFVERAATVIDDFSLTDADAASVGEICRRLDGLPLAIEFAAARVEVLGIRGLATHLSNSLNLLAGRRRGAMPRHRTIRAVLDWSYGLLSEDEKRFFRRLGIFSGSFSIEATAQVAMDAPQSRGDAIDLLTDLAAKSLLAADIGGAEPRFRLLETTRAYALDKLDQSGEAPAIARRHAEYYRDLFDRAETALETGPIPDLRDEYGWRLDNLRDALDWAFSSGGDASIGVALTVAAVPLWMHLSLLKECHSRVERALAAVEEGDHQDPPREMRLHAALGGTLLFTRGAVPEIGAAWSKALEIAERLGDAGYQLRSLWGLWLFHSTRGQHRVALALAQRFSSIATQGHDPNDRLGGEGMHGVSQHFLGDQPRARYHIEGMLAGYVVSNQRQHIIRFQTDQRVVGRAFLARILWLQGFADQAMHAVRAGVEAALATDHAVSLCYALARAACPIALMVGDLAAAENYVEMLLDHSVKHALALWHAFGRSYQGVLVIRRGDTVSGWRLLSDGFDELGEARYAARRLMSFLMAEALARAGQTGEGLTLIEDAVARSDATEERWLIAELLRLKGQLLLLQGAPGIAAEVEDLFRQAIDWAHRQGALSWELRAATSLGRLLREQGRPADAVANLKPVYDRFTEGFDTADLIEAKQLLDELNHVARD